MSYSEHCAQIRKTSQWVLCREIVVVVTHEVGKMQSL